MITYYYDLDLNIYTVTTYLNLVLFYFIYVRILLGSTTKLKANFVEAISESNTTARFNTCCKDSVAVPMLIVPKGVAD